jgi:hypothetical protein
VLSYTLGAAAHTSLEILDVRGRRIATLGEGWRDAGRHQITWHDFSTPSGIYFGRLRAGGNLEIQKLVRLR